MRYLNLIDTPHDRYLGLPLVVTAMLAASDVKSS